MSRTFGRLLVATLAWGVVAFGAVYPWAYWPLAAACAGLGVWAIVATRAWQDQRARGLAVALAAVVAAIGLQLVALPYALIGRLSPALDGFFREFQFGYHPAALHALSLAPEATLVVFLLACALAIFLLGLSRGIRYVSLDWLVTQLLGLGVTLAILGVVQRAFLDVKTPLVYGFWRPREGGNPFGPFINRNHFAGWMVMVVPLVAMHAWSVVMRSGRAEGRTIGGWIRWGTSVEGNRLGLSAVAATVMATTTIVTGSRSGMAAFAITVLVLAVFVLRGLPGRRRLAAAGYLAVVLVAALAWAGSDFVAARFRKAPGELEGRFAAWRDTTRIVQDFPIFGVGFGAYKRAMLVYQSAGREAIYAQAHNDYLQVAAEGGLLVGLPALWLAGTLIITIRRRLTFSDDDPLTFWIRRGAVAGLVGIAAQSVVEFSLQMPGNAAMCVLLIAIAIHRPRSAAPSHARRV